MRADPDPTWSFGSCLAFTRYSFTTRLLCTNQSSFYRPRPPAFPTRLQYDRTHIAQYTPPPTPLLRLLFTIQHWQWQYRVKAKLCLLSHLWRAGYCYCHCMVYSIQTGGRWGSRILPNNRAIVLHQGGQCRWAGGVKGWLIRAQQPRSKRISCCEGQCRTFEKSSLSSMFDDETPKMSSKRVKNSK